MFVHKTTKHSTWPFPQSEDEMVFWQIFSTFNMKWGWDEQRSGQQQNIIYYAYHANFTLQIICTHSTSAIIPNY